MTVAPDYYVPVATIALVLFPISWIVVPTAAFKTQFVASFLPQFLQPYLFMAQPLLAFLFIFMAVGHVFEVAYCWHRCRRLGFTPLNTVRWMVNVACHGVWCLSQLPDSTHDKKTD